MQLETFCFNGHSNCSYPLSQAFDPSRTLVILFGGSDFIESPEAVTRIAQAHRDCPVLGCSTSGEIMGTRIQDNSLVGAVVQFEKTQVKVASAPIQNPKESYTAGNTIGRELNHPDLRGVFVLSDGLRVNGSELVRGINAVLPESVVVTGGLAGDGDRFKRTWVIKDQIPQQGFVTAVGFLGDAVQIGHGSKGGWDIFGPERRVTRAQGNILHELDGRPALQLYKEYLGEKASALPASGLFFPLALRTRESETNQTVRTILAVNEADQSMTFAGDIPQDSLAQLMRANFDRLITGASEAATLSRNGNQVDTPTLAIAISCVGRRLVLGERTEEEIEATLDILPKESQQIGFYSYGELSPYTNGRCELHNQTMTLTTISEM